MKPISDKRRALLPQRAAVKQAAHDRDGWRCQFWPSIEAAERNTQANVLALPALPVACVQGLEAHEVIPRSAWRDGWLVLDNIKSLCPRHHQWVTEHPKAAHAIGLHGFSYERPKDAS